MFPDETMNILYLAHRIPYPPDKGDKLRAFRQLEHLAGQHQVWCACFADTPGDIQYTAQLKAFCREVAVVRLNRARAMPRGLLGLARGRTLTESFYDHSAMKRILRRWSQSTTFDAVVAFSSSMAPYALSVAAGRHVLDLCDLDSRKWSDYAERSRGPARWLYRIEGRRLAARERAWIEAFDASTLITAAEVEDLEGPVPPGKIHVVGNGVFLPELDGAESETVDDDSAPAIVGFLGVMDYRPNVDAVEWFVRQCWGRIRAACPGTVFRIIGRSPTRKVRRLAAVPGVEVVGAVDDAVAEVRKLRVSVAPMRIARGLQNKVLEAMAARRPVVLTTRAAEGIRGHHDHEYLVADTPPELIRSVVRLLCDPSTRARLGQAARRFVTRHHCWKNELRKFELLVTGALHPRERRIEPDDRVASPQTAARCTRALT